MTMSCWIILRTRNVWDEYVRKSKHIFSSVIFCLKIVLLMKSYGKVW